MLQPYFKLLDIPIAYFGILWAVFNLSAALFALFTNQFENFFGLKKSLVILSLLPILAHFSLYQFPYLWVLPFTLLYTMTRALSYPILQDYMNKELDSSVRATALSVYSLFSRFAFIVLSPLIGYFADVYSLQVAFLASAVIFGTLTFLSLPFLFKAHK